MARYTYSFDENFSKGDAPASRSETILPLDKIDPKVFESLCCELLIHESYKDLEKDVKDVLPIGISGQKQLGADIFVHLNKASLSVYELHEVKRVEKYTLSLFKKTVERFIKNYQNWGMNISSFNLFVSSELSAEQIVDWQHQASQMSDLKVEYKIQTKSKIQERLMDHPQLVYKYFHPAWTEIFFGDKAVWHIEKYGIYSFGESSSWVDYEAPSEIEYGDSYLYKNDHVSIQCYLPSISKRHASCLVELRNGRFSHVIITLNNQQLLDRYFIGVNTPFSQNGRKFIAKSLVNDSYICDLGNCRIEISHEETNALCVAFDKFWSAYKKRVKRIESVWRTKDFKSAKEIKNDIPLMTIKRGLWAQILNFSRAHDAFQTKGQWSLFDSTANYLKVYSSKATDDLSAGYHAYVMPYKSFSFGENFQYIDNDVVLAWHPPVDFLGYENETQIGPRNFWDALTCHDWLKDELIPEVVRWMNEESKPKSYLKSLFNWLKPSQNLDYNPDDYLTSFYKPSNTNSLTAIKNVAELLRLSEQLQNFYHASPEFVYLDNKSYKGLYRSLSEVLKYSKLDNFGYLHGNLNYLKASDLESLIIAVEDHSENSDESTTNHFRIDCALRCIVVCLRDAKNNLNEVEITRVVEKLMPLIAIMEDTLLLRRQIQS